MVLPGHCKNIKVLREVCGHNTGDRIIIDEARNEWIVTPYFTYQTGTGDRLGFLKDDMIYEA